MPELKLTDRSIRSLSSEKLQEDFKDTSFMGGEFGVRVSNSGSKRFFVRYRVNGKRRRMMIGAYPALSLAEARQRALKLSVNIEDGADPAKAKTARKKKETVENLFNSFMKQKESSFAKTTYRNYWAMWRKDCLKLLGDMKPNDIERSHIVEVLDLIEERTVGPHMVNRTRTMLMSMFNWAVGKDLCKYNPVLGVPKAQKKELPGERFLSSDEILNYWKFSEEQDAQSKGFWRLLLLLALRPGEVMKLRWSWIDGDVLNIPGSQVKNGRAHQLYLGDFAMCEMDNIRCSTGDSDFLFPGSKEDSHRLDFTDSHQKLAERMNCPYWTARDIRRTCETQMRTFIRDGEGISRVLNHDVTAIRRTYDKGDYFDRKKQVLVLWNDWLAGLFEDNLETQIRRTGNE